ncbi:glycosyltransferase family 4 protein [Enterobacter vonholyi]|uniref:glycosyltransferase family 4 protein n=1 Tax=Enterobacter vonholyi TaxID=2797505 RepID=UPI0020BEE142|nr:glycosyltransferase family 4 protein [Enterobacter vonholyi]MCL5635979.1 glycosyltransferase family 4 protein [Enterobacter vonholyi]
MDVDKPLKIAHVQVLPKMSGAQMVSYEILSRINNNDAKKYIICGELTEDSNDFKDMFSSAGVEIIQIPSIKRSIGLHDIKAFCKLYRLFRSEKFDIVHTNSTKPAIIARIAARLAGIKKIVHTVHGIAFHRSKPLPVRIFYFTLEYISALFGHVNVSVNEYYTKYYPFIKTIVIKNGVDFSNLEFKNDANGGESLHFAFMARLDEQKNPMEFLEAVKLFKKHYKGNIPVRFSMAGSGPHARDCIDFANYSNLYDVLDFTGWIRDKSEFLNSVDVICQPSNWEAFGIVFVEAAYFEIPSIAKRVEGVPEVILDNITGMTYSGGKEELCKCMLLYANSPGVIKEHGKAARNKALSEFSVNDMVVKYKAIYNI